MKISAVLLAVLSVSWGVSRCGAASKPGDIAEEPAAVDAVHETTPTLDLPTLHDATDDHAGGADAGPETLEELDSGSPSDADEKTEGGGGSDADLFEDIDGVEEVDVVSDVETVTPPVLPCASNLDCAVHDDGNACTGTLVCLEGVCVVDTEAEVGCATAVNPCQVSACSPFFGVCLPSAVEDGTACDDGNPCTVSTQCIGGLCLGEKLPCDDGDPCTLDVCDPSEPVEICIHVPLVCDDKNPCTQDDCVPLVGCTNTTLADLTACDDSIPCTQDTVCMGGNCLSGIWSCAELCDNEADDDDDGRVDCADPDCLHPSCRGETCVLPFALNGILTISDLLPQTELFVTGDTSDARDDFIYDSSQSWQPKGPDEVWSFTLSSFMLTTIRMSFDQPNKSPLIYLYHTNCTDKSNIVSFDDTYYGGTTVEMADIPLAPGNYFIIIDAATLANQGSYWLEAVFTAPVGAEADCQDGVDEDLDGTVDCGDIDCAVHPYCAGESCVSAFPLHGGIPIGASESGVVLSHTGIPYFTSPDLPAECSDPHAWGRDKVWTFSLAEPMFSNIKFWFEQTNAYSPDGCSLSLLANDCNPDNRLACDVFLYGPNDVGTYGELTSQLLQPGTYYIVADDGFVNALTPFHLQVSLAAPEPAETQCADRLDSDSDGATDCADKDCYDATICLGQSCLSAYSLAPQGVITAADAGLSLSVQGDTTGLQNRVDLACGTRWSKGPDQAWMFTLAEPMLVSLTLEYEAAGAYAFLHLFSGSACDGETVVGCDESSLVAGPAVISSLLLQPGTWYVVADSGYADMFGPYSLTVDFGIASETELQCSDRIDNDTNNKLDCDDPQCAGAAECLGESFSSPKALNGGLELTAAMTGLMLNVSGETSAASNDVERVFDSMNASVGRDAVWSFVLTDPMRVSALSGSAGSAGEGQVLMLYKEGAAGPEHVASSPTYNKNATQAILDRDLMPGTYYLVVDYLNWAGAGPYWLRVSFGTVQAQETHCADYINNDGDAKSDCLDSDCLSAPECAVETDCADGINNDPKTLKADCSDPACATQAMCAGATCQNAILINEGQPLTAADSGKTFTVTGNSVRAAHNTVGSCASGNGGETIYKLQLAAPMLVTVDHKLDLFAYNAHVYIRTGQCTWQEELVCAKGPALIKDIALPAGTWFIYADTYQDTDGPFTMHIAVRTPPESEVTCNDQIDNNANGETDCDDPDCSGHPHCLVHTLPYADGFESEGGFPETMGLDGWPGCPWRPIPGGTLGAGWAMWMKSGNCHASLETRLVTPPLSVAGCSQLQVSFYQKVAWSSLAEHTAGLQQGLQESAVFVTAPTAEDVWAEAPTVITLPVSGVTVARFFFGYVGVYSDDWYVDDLLISCVP